MVLSLWCYGLDLRLLHAYMYACEITKFVHSTYIIISNQVDKSWNDHAYRYLDL